MKVNPLSLLPLLILAPYIVSPTPADSSFNEYSFGVGGGQYGAYDCEYHSIARSNSFVDAGANYTHKFEGPYRIGVAVSVINDVRGFLAYPDLALDYPGFSIGTTGVRIGREDALYAEASVANQVPLFSGKGFSRFGVGWRSQQHNTRFWVGVNSFPYHNGGLAGQIDVPISSNKSLFFNGRVGKFGDISEYGFSAGVRIRGY